MLPLGIPAPSQATGAERKPDEISRGERSEVLHRVVWDASRRQGPKIKIVSAELDGSDRKVLYRRNRGFVLDLTLNREGTRVAMAPFRPRGRALLVVADVRSGEHTDVLADARRFELIGGIGWSPNGRRLVFEGGVQETSGYAEYLWTIKQDGTDLKRLNKLQWDVDSGEGFSNAVAWRKRGIYHLNDRGLVVLRDGKDRLLVRNARRLYISGNGRWLFVHRGTGMGSYRRLRPSGEGLKRIVSKISPNPRMGYMMPIVPDYSGRRLLTRADGPRGGGISPSTFVHPATRAPRPSDPQLQFTDSAYVVTWN